MRQIYCVNLCGEKAAEAAAFVLSDFKDAYAAYEQMSSVAGAEKSYSFVEKASKADTVVVAYEHVEDACEYVASLKPNTKVYGIAVADVLPSQAITGLDTACKRKSCTWQGSLVITKEPVVVVALQKKPRLGWWRRKLSEAIDRLIACARAGVSIQEAPDLFGATKKQRTQAGRNLILVS